MSYMNDLWLSAEEYLAEDIQNWDSLSIAQKQEMIEDLVRDRLGDEIDWAVDRYRDGVI